MSLKYTGIATFSTFFQPCLKVAAKQLSTIFKVTNFNSIGINVIIYNWKAPMLQRVVKFHIVHMYEQKRPIINSATPLETS